MASRNRQNDFPAETTADGTGERHAHGRNAFGLHAHWQCWLGASGSSDVEASGRKKCRYFHVKGAVGRAPHLVPRLAKVRERGTALRHKMCMRCKSASRAWTKSKSG
jgi:hypothetical protein